MKPVFLKFLQAILLLLVFWLLASNSWRATGAEIGCTEREMQALFQFKAGLVDKYGLLSSWGSEEGKRDCCEWKGVHCSNQTGHVEMLNLHGNSSMFMELEGNISTSMMELDHLMYLNLSGNDFKGNNIPEFFGSLSNLRYLDLKGCSLGGNIPIHLGRLPHLRYLDLSGNCLQGSIPYQLANLSQLQYLDLSFNDALKIDQENGQGEWLSNLTSLTYLDLSEVIYLNHSDIIIMKSFNNMCTLRSLTLYNCHLSEELSTILENLSGCARYTLQKLDLSRNQITGTLPIDLSIFTSLKTLYLFKNQLNGRIPENIQFPYQLVTLSIAFNSLEGNITDSHFANISNLKYLDLSYNSLALTFSKNWVPSFQLDTINLASCMLGPHFPEWLQTQHYYSMLDISDARISDIVPKWFWSQLSSKVSLLNISHNNLMGTIPNFPIRFTEHPILYLTSNQFEGSIPPFLHSAFTLHLSNNKFSESLMFLCSNNATETLSMLYLSNNQLSGELPNCWSHFNSLVYLDLSNNNLSGKVPTSIGSIHELQTLKLRNNSFTGELPFSFKSCSKLEILDVGENRLSGLLPPWIGNGLQHLQILSLRRNHFSGSLPMNICHLISIRLLDLSFNNISGEIPKCFNNFTAMTQESVSIDSFNDSYVFNRMDGGKYYYSDILDALLMWKGTEQLFEGKEMQLLKIIDLSSNQLSGEIPIEIGDLVQLICLNLSRNNLIGKIPSNIGRLTSLEFLDLSRNHLIGSIPSSLAQIDRLTKLNLSHNNLFGKIPIGTQLQSFDESSYEDNLDLCGKPLEKKCSEEETPQPKDKFQKDGDSIFSKSFYWSMSMGFITGFCGIFGSILFNRSWRHTYFKFLNNLTDTIYVIAAINLARCHRLLKQ